MRPASNISNCGFPVHMYTMQRILPDLVTCRLGRRRTRPPAQPAPPRPRPLPRPRNPTTRSLLRPVHCASCPSMHAPRSRAPEQTLPSFPALSAPEPSAARGWRRRLRAAAAAAGPRSRPRQRQPQRQPRQRPPTRARRRSTEPSARTAGWGTAAAAAAASQKRTGG
eukprot:360038-Chlamydomonas_euryale.AAC.2